MLDLELVGSVPQTDAYVQFFLRHWSLLTPLSSSPRLRLDLVTIRVFSPEYSVSTVVQYI